MPGLRNAGSLPEMGLPVDTPHSVIFDSVLIESLRHTLRLKVKKVLRTRRHLRSLNPMDIWIVQLLAIAALILALVAAASVIRHRPIQKRYPSKISLK